MSEIAPAAPPNPEPGPPPRGRKPWRALAWALAAIMPLLALALVVAALMWAVGSASGTAWLLGRVPGLTLTAPQGSLLGDFSAERLEIALPDGSAGDRLVIGGLRWRGLSLAHTPASATWFRLGIDSLQADRVDLLLTLDPNAPPPAPPRTLQLPIEIEVRVVDIAEFHAAALVEQPLLGLHAQLHFSADGGRTHRIDGLSLAWDHLAARGTAQIASAAPFDVQARLAIEPRPAGNAPGAKAPPSFDATVDLSGPLARFAVQATLRGAPPGGKKGGDAPSLDLSATVLPFAAWPLATLQLQTHSLDLAALHSSAPGTSLSGIADVVSEGSDRPATVTITLANARAGRFDEGLLPLRSLKADVRARPDDPRQIDIHALEMTLGTAREAGGQLQGSGLWTPQRATLAAALSNIAPRVLDARAPEAHFSGRAELQADNWFGGGSADARPSLALRGRVDGSLLRDGHPQSAQLDFDVAATTSRVDLRKANLQTGDSRATLAGQAVRQGHGDWLLTGHGALAEFNPALWWPGVDGSAWRTGVHRLNGALDLDWQLPSLAGAAPLSLQRLAASPGQATLRVADSLLAGTPLAGEIKLRGEGTAGLGVSASLALASATLALRGRLAPDARDHWEIDVHAADLALWSPLLQLVQPVGKPVPVLAGVLDGEAQLDGRWPETSSRGRIDLKDARASTVHLARAALRWTASTAPQAPLDVQAEIEQLGVGAQKLDSLRLTVQGTAAEHRIALSAASPVQPPKWVDLLHGIDTAAVAARAAEPATGTVAELRAQGALQFDTAWQQPLRWHGHLQQLETRRRGGNLPAPWFRITESELDAQYDPLSGAPRVTLSPGRAELPNMALRWSQLRWQGGSVPQLDLQAEIEPFAVAPLLARLQPDFGWGGDLAVAGHVNVHGAPSFVAEIEFGRQGGDLKVTDEAGTQALELTDLRLALEARDGVWHFTQALAGKSLGAMAGAVTVRTDAKAFWPPADAPLQGVLELRIADLAAWGAWAPAGWRMKGQMHAGASFGGRFGAPEYTGQVDGSGLAARNLVEGVDVHDGELDIVLEGETAQIRKLQARAGNGSVQVGGEAFFGATPHLQLHLAADKLLVLGRVDRRIVASGDAGLQLRPGSLQLDGRFTVDQGLIDISRGNAPSLGGDVRVTREHAADTAEGGAPRVAPVREVKMNLVVNLGPALRLRGRGLDTRLQGELLLTAPDGKLAINGSVNAVEGTYAAYGQKLRIERGSVSFSGAVDNPRLDILALRPNLDIRVGVAITGTTNNPRIALFSDPDLPDNQKLSWLVLGRAPEGANGSDTALLQAAAMALLAGEGDGLGSQLTQLNPLDTLSVRQGEGIVRDTVVSVGKQLSQRWYIGYERSLSQTAGNWQLIYRLAQRFTVRLQTGIDNSIDLIWSWRWE
jgi:translocation and assembly module TamB